MQYDVRIMPSAQRALLRLDVQTQERLLSAIDRLAEDPRPLGCRKLTGVKDIYRIRVGRYRRVYRIRDEVLAVLVIDIGHRRDVYRRIWRS